MNNKFKELFKVNKPIIGMIHLAGDSTQEKINRAKDELTFYRDWEVNGAIIEDYHADYIQTLEAVVQLSKHNKGLVFSPNEDFVLGTNILEAPYLGFGVAATNGLGFVQFDSVQERDLDAKKYEELRENFPSIVVLGGVGFKYTQSTGNKLEDDLDCAKTRCDAIVTTGEGTGIETPIEKLKQYKEILGDFPLIVGAGVNLSNVKEQLKHADGAIVGSYFKKDNNTENHVESRKVYDFMNAVKGARALDYFYSRSK